MRFHVLILAVTAGLLSGCAVEQEAGGVLPLDRRLPLSGETMNALGGPEVAGILLGPDTRDLVVERMRLNGDRGHGPAWVTFPERRADPVIDGALLQGLCSVGLRRVVMAEDGRGIRDIERVNGRIVLGGAQMVARSDPDFSRRVADSRVACADWSRAHPQAWFVDTGLARQLTVVAQGLADLPAGIAAGRIDCADTCAQLQSVIANRELTGTYSCIDVPAHGEGAFCVTALFEAGEGGYVWEEVRMTGPEPAPGQPFHPTYARVDTQVVIVN